MRMLPAGVWINADARYRWFRGFSDRQTGQSHPIIGTPTEVPVPRKTKVRSPVMESGLPNGRGGELLAQGPDLAADPAGGRRVVRRRQDFGDPAADRPHLLLLHPPRGE